MSVDKCTRTVGGVRIPQAVCVRHLRYVYTPAHFLRCLYTYGRSLTGINEWRRSEAIATLGDGVYAYRTSRRNAHTMRRSACTYRRCVYTKVRQPAHVHVSIRHFKIRAQMTFSIGFVHAGPCACPHVPHWLVQYSI